MESLPKVIEYLVKGVDYFETRSQLQGDTIDSFCEVIRESMGEKGPYTFYAFSREDILLKIDELSHHSIERRSSLWVHVIELLRQNKYNEATAIMATERLLFLETHYIQ